MVVSLISLSRRQQKSCTLLLLLLVCSVFTSPSRTTTRASSSSSWTEQEEAEELEVLKMLRDLQEEEFIAGDDEEAEEMEEEEEIDAFAYPFSSASMIQQHEQQQKEETVNEEEEDMKFSDADSSIRGLQSTARCRSTEPVKKWNQKLYIQITGVSGGMGDQDLYDIFAKLLLDLAIATDSARNGDPCLTFTSTDVIGEVLERLDKQFRVVQSLNLYDDSTRRELGRGTSGISYNSRLNIVHIFEGQCRCRDPPINSDAWNLGRRRQLMRSLQLQSQLGTMAQKFKQALIDSGIEMFACTTGVEFFLTNPGVPPISRRDLSKKT
eukprot:CAMPEP_0118704548 /NCGR_PEP_ID=MMETSP0800-20121206/19301_1 /TAXON_ID=210618 ORGANISM="Striatella unipunctata, Strain CCMP2910" /NCGR_SAMPLE_ID=MMETSP0800 /ASSEMBLY_ACC=CAM_ASM_000638 /LENGTH=323 /DNA_ID=CAMNT_0006606459 /DNA_START=42 /DNA_END=1010 /DNA_ORIENTATION=-